MAQDDSRPAEPRDAEEVVRRAFDGLAHGDVEAMLPFVHDDFQMVTPPELASEPGTYAGHDGVRRWFDSFYEAMDEVRVEPLRTRAAGARVVVWFRIVTRGRSSGIDAVQHAAGLCTVVDSKVHRMQFFVTWEEALEAAEPGERSPGVEGGR